MTNDLPIPEALRSLGNPLQVHPPRAGSGRAGYFTAAVVFAILAGLTVIGIVNPPEHNPPPPVVLIAVMGVCLALALVLFGVGLYSPQSCTLILFPDGVAQTGKDGPEMFRWNEIKEIYTFINPIAGKHRIVTQDGRKLEIDARVKDGKKLGLAVQQTLFDRMLPGAVKAFEQGETLTFGPLRLDQNSLYYKAKVLGWNEIAKMQLLYNAYTRCFQFEVKAAGSMLLPWCVVKAQDIANLDVFKSLAERKRSFEK